MTKLHTMLAAGAGALGLAAAAGLSDATGEGAGAHDRADLPALCEIRAHHAGAMTELEGIVRAEAPFAGTWRLRATKKGGGGSADIDQSGDIALAAGESATVATLMFGGGGEWSAELEIAAGQAPIICVDRSGGAL